MRGDKGRKGWLYAFMVFEYVLTLNINRSNGLPTGYICLFGSEELRVGNVLVYFLSDITSTFFLQADAGAIGSGLQV